MSRASDHGMGRLVAPDNRDTMYPMRALLPRRIPRVSRFYSTGPVLDQGNKPQCVAYAWKQWLDSAPIKDPVKLPPDPQAIYAAAQAVDEWPGTDYDGTSVRAGAKTMEALERIGAYHWATSVEDVRDYIISTTTVVFGTDWFEGMFRPTYSGYVKPSGAVAGGHAYLCIGYSQSRGAFRFLNSWGEKWGRMGRFWMSAEDVQTLLDRDGEACAGVELRV